MYYNKFPFSIILNDGIAFPNMPKGELLVFGKHDQAIARCDYHGNMDRIHPDADTENDETSRFILINKDRDSIMAWAGQRRNTNPRVDFDDGYRDGLINWRKALKDKIAKAERRKHKRHHS
jgi:hypothetical protein